MKKRFPQYLSKPYQILWFESDELIMILMFFILAITLGKIYFVMLIIGPYLYSKGKKSYPRGFMRHCLYFCGFSKMQGYPSYFEEEFIE